MIQEPVLQTTEATGLPGLPASVSSAVVRMIDRLKPGVVQVRSGQRGAGAGIVWRADGAILTNYHVVAAGERLNGQATLEVLLPDGRSFAARVVDRNPTLDLAMLSIPAQDLPAVPVGDSSRLRVGELVFAIGHPWGQPWVVTAGIVSGTDTLEVGRSRRTARYIRSDVRLAPGNSGGPLLDAHGTVVGINAMIFGGDLSVAIPSHVAGAWLAGPPGRPAYLGAQVQPVELPDASGPDRRATGLLVVGLTAGGPAERASLLVGDVLLAVDHQPVADAETLLGALAQAAARGQVELSILRGGVRRALTVALPQPEQPA